MTEWFAVIDRTQVPVPEQSPDHPVKRDLVPGVAVSVTVVPFVNVATQVGPQLMPAGELVTVPVPGPLFDTVSVQVVGGGGGGGAGGGGGGGGGGAGGGGGGGGVPPQLGNVKVPIRVRQLKLDVVE